MVKTDRKNGKWLSVCQICDQFFKNFPMYIITVVFVSKVSGRVYDMIKIMKLLVSGSSDYTVYIDMTENVGGRGMGMTE